MRWTLDTGEQDARSAGSFERIRKLGERLVAPQAATSPAESGKDPKTDEVTPTSEWCGTPTSEYQERPEFPLANLAVYILALVVILLSANAILTTNAPVATQSAKPTVAKASLTYVVAYDDPQHTQPLATFTPSERQAKFRYGTSWVGYPWQGDVVAWVKRDTLPSFADDATFLTLEDLQPKQPTPTNVEGQQAIQEGPVVYVPQPVIMPTDTPVVLCTKDGVGYPQVFYYETRVYDSKGGLLGTASGGSCTSHEDAQTSVALRAIDMQTAAAATITTFDATQFPRGTPTATAVATKLPAGSCPNRGQLYIKERDVFYHTTKIGHVTGTGCTQSAADLDAEAQAANLVSRYLDYTDGSGGVLPAVLPTQAPEPTREGTH